HAPEAIQAALNTLLDDEQMCRQLGQQARKRIMAEYTLERTADRLRQLYDAVLHRRVADLTASSLGVES
ncbi:MAG: glycosyltransferase, partial [Anaerolineales bacterium]|nr:glycosyltransferase [Anaerolineales bacterium]